MFLSGLFLIGLGVVLGVLSSPKTSQNTIEESAHQKAGRLTYEHFMKASNDVEMRRFLIANHQDPKDFEGCSRLLICERMKRKAELNGVTYLREWP